ncbi:MAG: hypothetical protein AAGD14_08540 [Planctomycetota bacterium]
MRTMLTLLLLAAPTLADEAADLFYRAYWLEHSGGDRAEAEKLYRALVEKHPKAPEAPRAYLALIRIRAQQGKASPELLKKLEGGSLYQEAAKLFPSYTGGFNAQPAKADDPLQAKLKTIYADVLKRGKFGTSDSDFLNDIGVAGHPMLAAVLRSSNANAVYGASMLCVAQQTPEADAVLLGALRDEKVFYRLNILNAFRSSKAHRLPLMEALHDMWPTASRSMRRRIVAAWSLATVNPQRTPKEVSAACWRFLATALQDDDPEVITRALAVNMARPLAKDPAWVRAALPHLSKPGRQPSVVEQLIPWQVTHASLREQLEQWLIDRPGPIPVYVVTAHAQQEGDVTPGMAESWARIVIGRCEKHGELVTAQKSKDGSQHLATMAARNSDAAAELLQRYSIRKGFQHLSWRPVVGTLNRPKMTPPRPAFVPSDEFREEALRSYFEGTEEISVAARNCLRWLTADDFDRLLEFARRPNARPIPFPATSVEYLQKIGEARAAQLVPFADEDGRKAMMRAAWKDGRLFWRAMLPFLGREESKRWSGLASFGPPLAREVLFALLEKRGADWEWDTQPGGVRVNGFGPNLLRSLHIRSLLKTDPEARARLYRYASDERYEVAIKVVDVARADRSDAGTQALVASLDKNWWEAVERSLKALSERGPEGLAAIETFGRSHAPGSAERQETVRALRKVATKEQLPYLREELRTRPGNTTAKSLWILVHRLEPRPTLEYAWSEFNGDGPLAFRLGALEALRQAEDPWGVSRRTSAFRSILQSSKEPAAVAFVLRAVANQYLVECGPDVLRHLRSPDDQIRKLATSAIERLRFYAEAKKLFEE